LNKRKKNQKVDYLAIELPLLNFQKVFLQMVRALKILLFSIIKIAIEEEKPKGLMVNAPPNTSGNLFAPKSTKL